MTLREFNNLPLDGFYDMYSDIQLLTVLKNLQIKTLLDADAHFAKSRLFTKAPNDSLDIDCICREDLLPMKENMFRHVYKDFSDCALKHYDAALIAERTPADFQNVYSALEHSAKLVITFVRNGSALIKYFRDTAGNFERVNALLSFAGAWVFCYRRTPHEDFAMYVVTHKPLPPEYVQRLPAGYRVIHAGRALGQDFGYLGDDTGENISNLNPYLNELTAFYWMWKNAKHEIIGLSHYRRFFTTDVKTFLTESDARKFLKDYDIITGRMSIHRAPTHEILRGNICQDEMLASFAESVMRQNLMRAHPDYLDAFDYKMNSPTNYYKNMFVTRKPVFDAYCEWLFSFMLDSTREVLSRTPLSKLEGGARRLMGHFAERMLTVWLLKNRLRIKEIPIVQIPGL